MYDSDIKSLANEVERFEKKVNNINLNDDPYQIKAEIEELETKYEDLNTKIEDTDTDLKDSSDSNSKPLLNKLSQFRTDLEIAKNKLNEKKNAWKTSYNMELLKGGQLSGYEKVKAERDIIMDQHKETDYQGDMIKDIGDDIKAANKNLEGINSELKDQGERINNVQGTAMNIKGKVATTEKVMSQIEFRNKCAKVIGAIGIIVVGLADIFFLIFKLTSRND